MLSDSTYQASDKTVVKLARALHEAGREAVEGGNVLAPKGQFIDWEHLPENVREGRRMQARALIQRLDILVVMLT